DEILRQTMTAIDVIAGCRRGVDERSVGLARGAGAGEVGRENGRAPDRRQAGLELVRKRERAVDDRKLKVRGHAAAARLKVQLPVVVLRQAELSAVLPRRLAQDALGRPLHAELVDRAVHPVIERPGQAALLQLDVRQASEAGAEQLLLVRDAVV